ncbi:MAG: hypothetical protein KDD60_04945, partial [Bdellovibrionales bacterium]|nr:hypothetical protein [Bdellovibrionales bacterium]
SVLWGNRGLQLTKMEPTEEKSSPSIRIVTPQRGIEVFIIVGILILGIFSFWRCLSMWRTREYDEIARQTSLQLQSVVFNATKVKGSGDQFAFLNMHGPMAFTGLLAGASLPSGVRADVFRFVVRKRNSRATSLTTIEVSHKDGSLLYRFFEQGGRSVQQTVRLDTKES